MPEKRKITKFQNLTMNSTINQNTKRGLKKKIKKLFLLGQTLPLGQLLPLEECPLHHLQLLDLDTSHTVDPAGRCLLALGTEKKFLVFLNKYEQY